MGIHICFMKDDKDHEDWDYLRKIHDRDFPSLINWDEVEFKDDDNEEWRPKDIQALKARIHDTGWDNKERYLHLVSLIEDNPDYWLFFPY